jgi:hypothetical protein
MTDEIDELEEKLGELFIEQKNIIEEEIKIITKLFEKLKSIQENMNVILNDY